MKYLIWLCFRLGWRKCVFTKGIIIYLKIWQTLTGQNLHQKFGKFLVINYKWDSPSSQRLKSYTEAQTQNPDVALLCCKGCARRVQAYGSRKVGPPDKMGGVGTCWTLTPMRGCQGPCGRREGDTESSGLKQKLQCYANSVSRMLTCRHGNI